ncbi:hypothetical protein SCP_0409640 [Sparassis crispa]|uniref:Uncharacterized protein n=1 Tax=Sparassis crispa TaxID=139825 RepID=A0A401GK91_9APHY|nr:hypothetical protein SCP_0409640 [Sparassis crispa]GBE82580.1 hypothetical protein SCP_0409640 [Sparassis crispa]
MDTTAEPSSNSLGLELDALHIQDNAEQLESPKSVPVDTADATESPKASELADVPKSNVDENAAGREAPKSEAKKPDSKEKKKPYVNPERVKTGGAQRDKLSEDELAERMARIREQNEKIKQRRMDVQADEDAFRKTQEAERIKVAKTKKVQENVDRTREQNARRKMEKMQNREWDSGKQIRDWKPATADEGGHDAVDMKKARAHMEIRSAVRGAGEHGRGRGKLTEEHIDLKPTADAPTSSVPTTS